MSTKISETRRVRGLVGGAVLVLAVALGGLAVLLIDPGPGDPPVEPLEGLDRPVGPEQWEEIEAWAEPASHGSPERLVAAVARMEGHRGELDTLLARFDSVTPRIAPEELPRDVRAALADLVAWHEGASPGIGEGLCPDELPPLPLNDLLRTAIHLTEGPESPVFDAALHAAWSLRQQGGALLGAVGFRVAAQALVVAGEGPPAPALARYRPSMDEVFPILAREWVCSYRMAERELKGGEGAERAKLAVVERELSAARSLAVAVLNRARPVRADPAKLALAVAIPDGSKRPKSPLARLLSLDASHLVQDWGRIISDYDRALPAR